MESTVTEEYFQEFKNMGEVSSAKCHRSHIGERKCILCSHINIIESFNGIFKKENKISRVNEMIIQGLTYF